MNFRIDQLQKVIEDKDTPAEMKKKAEFELKFLKLKPL